MSEGRVALRGIPASPGVVVGRARVIAPDRMLVARRHVPERVVPHEVERLRAAVDASRGELETIRDRVGRDAPASYRLILDAHLMMHSDDMLIGVAVQHIETDRINAEWAIERAVEGIKERLSVSTDTYFRGRALDIEHLGRRIQRQLAGRDSSLPPMEANEVLVADDLHPADAAQLVKHRVQALVTGLGSATSHVAILARTLDIPAVVGAVGVTGKVGSGDIVIVDGLHGEVVLGADQAERGRAEARAQRYRRFTKRLRERDQQATQTSDGVEVELLANAELVAEAELASGSGAAGIGLYRTEYLFLERDRLPDEEEQADVYADIVRAMAPRPVVFRTNDAGGDRLTLVQVSEPAPNPALGLRALRLGLARPGMLKTQLRAILRAAAQGPVQLMFPMVSGLDELRRARALLEEAASELDARGTERGEVAVGVMIELPAAVMMADKLAVECDFFAVGTNDLVQYSLAVDRANPMVAYLATPIEPPVLKLLALVAQAAREHGLPLSICGDMAADPIALPLVLGLGYQRLSVPIGSLPLVRELVGRVAMHDAQMAARQALECGTAGEVREVIVRTFSDALAEVWDEQGIEL